MSWEADEAGGRTRCSTPREGCGLCGVHLGRNDASPRRGSLFFILAIPATQLLRALREVLERPDAFEVVGERVVLNPTVWFTPHVVGDMAVDPPQMCHLHVSVQLGSFRTDTCVTGLGGPGGSGLADAADNWAFLVFPLLHSLVRQRPELGAEHFSPEAPLPYGVPGMHGFVSPVLARGLAHPERYLKLPFFSAGIHGLIPGLVQPLHILKSTVARREDGWIGTLELDGHEMQASVDVSQSFPQDAGPGYATRYALIMLV